MTKCSWIFAGALLAGAGTHAFEIASRISPEIASKPIEVRFLVHPGVDPADRDAAITKILRAYKAIEDIPTCGLRFTVKDTVPYSRNLPGFDPRQTFVIVGNADELESGGASYPSGGNPGGWHGAVADVPVDLYQVGLHEIGHSLGLGHTTIGLAFTGSHPIMHWASAATALAQDDIAALSIAYPDPVRDLRKETGCITGRVVAQGLPGASAMAPVPGVNAVAVDAAGRPVIASLSQATGVPGRFELCGLPPGAYSVRFLDGTSYRGILDKESLPWIRKNAQAYNAPEPAPVQRTVAAGDAVDVGDIRWIVERIRGDSLYLGPLIRDARFQAWDGRNIPLPASGNLNAWIHLRGGVRGLATAGLGPQSRLQARIDLDDRTTADAINGNQFLTLSGAVPREGLLLRIPVTDRRGITDTLEVAIGLPTAIGPRRSAEGAAALGGIGDGAHDALGRLAPPASPVRRLCRTGFSAGK